MSKINYPNISDESDSDVEGDEEDNEKEKMELNKFEQLIRDGNAGTLSATEVEQYIAEDEEKKDRTFQKFVRITKRAPKQVVRYSRGGKPLWVSDKEMAENVPSCEICGGPRIFEFQLMPQLLDSLKFDSSISDASVDWGVLVIYSCRNSCDTPGPAYKKEFLFRQNVRQ
jgi:pre-rRNA-processing protein TSR4